MAERNDKTRLVSQDRLDKAIELLNDLEQIDTSNLEQRLESTIARKKRRKRISILSRYIAAVAGLLLIGGILLNIDRPSGQAAMSRINDDVVLFISDGSNVTMSRLAGDTLVAERDDVTVRLESGKLIYAGNDGASHDENGVFYSKLVVPCGKRFDIVLSDGTHVWLNSGSNLNFPSVFTGDERKVTLTGEAYFEVSPDAGKPFVVETQTQILTVLGTEFNVYAYPADAAVHTTLIEGSVSLKSLETNAEIMLTPNHQAILNGGNFTLNAVNSREFIEWRNGLFVFEGNTMEQIMQKLARWYDIDYSFRDAAAASLVAKGCIPIQDDITTILDILQKTGPLKFETSENHIRISMKQ